MSPSDKNTALLVMDVQGATIKMLEHSASFLDKVSKAVKAARSQGMPVIYVIIGFRKGYPEVSPNNKSFSTLKNGSTSFDTEEASQIPALIAPLQEDIVITKKRISAFTGSDLEVVLRSLGINRLVLSGIATSGVVLSTLRKAADKDYALTVLADCCADRDEEVHRVLTTKVFPRQAEVTTVEEWSSV